MVSRTIPCGNWTPKNGNRQLLPPKQWQLAEDTFLVTTRCTHSEHERRMFRDFWIHIEYAMVLWKVSVGTTDSQFSLLTIMKGQDHLAKPHFHHPYRWSVPSDWQFELAANIGSISCDYWDVHVVIDLCWPSYGCVVPTDSTADPVGNYSRLLILSTPMTKPTSRLSTNNQSLSTHCLSS